VVGQSEDHRLVLAHERGEGLWNARTRLCQDVVFRGHRHVRGRGSRQHLTHIREAGRERCSGAAFARMEWICGRFSGAMQIHIVIHRSPVRSNDVLRRLWRVSRQMACRVLGHRNEVAVGSGTLALKCDRCGWRSPGWMLDKRPAASSHGDTSHSTL